MAERLKEFEFKGRGRPGYPWNEWLDGSIWKLQAGVDFKCQEETFRGGVYKAALRHGLALNTALINEAGKKALVIQAIKKPSDAQLG